MPLWHGCGVGMAWRAGVCKRRHEAGGTCNLACYCHRGCASDGPRYHGGAHTLAFRLSCDISCRAQCMRGLLLRLSVCCGAGARLSYTRSSIVGTRNLNSITPATKSSLPRLYWVGHSANPARLQLCRNTTYRRGFTNHSCDVTRQHY
jgi:hypothetical protein